MLIWLAWVVDQVPPCVYLSLKTLGEELLSLCDYLIYDYPLFLKFMIYIRYSLGMVWECDGNPLE